MARFLIKIPNNQCSDIFLPILAILGLFPTGEILSTEYTVGVSLNRKFSLLLSHFGSVYTIEPIGKVGHYSAG